MHERLTAEGVKPAVAAQVADAPPVGSLFAAFLGYNPMQTLLGEHGLDGVPKANADRHHRQDVLPGAHLEAVHRRSADRVLVLVPALPDRRLGVVEDGRAPNHPEPTEVSEALEEVALS